MCGPGADYLPKQPSGNANRQRGADAITVISGHLNTTFRVYPDGVRVGCTFVTKEAIRLMLPQLKELIG